LCSLIARAFHAERTEFNILDPVHLRRENVETTILPDCAFIPT
jgi:hypothetical protein